MQSAKLWIIFSFLLAFFLVKIPVYATSVTLSNTPPSITEEPFTVHVKVSGAQANTTNYLRINLYETGTTQYFGYTHNGSDWYNGSTHSSYSPINIDSNGTWEGEVQGKLDTASPYYKGPGEYNIKVRRYTAGGSYIWSNEIIITISTVLPTSIPSPTLTTTPTKTPTPTPTTKPTSTPKIPTPTKTPTLTPVKSQPTVVLIANDNQDVAQEALPTSILGASTEGAANNISPTDNSKIKISPPEKETKAFKSSKDNLSKILIGIGVIFLIACGILAVRAYIKSRKENENIYHK